MDEQTTVRIKSNAEVDSAFEKFKVIKEQISAVDISDQNEAETRLKHIDPILQDVLGWGKTQISCERSEEGKRIDYGLNTSSANAIVEAKRPSSEFIFPDSENIKYSLSGPVLTDGALGAAIKQAREYAFEHGAEIAAVTNGVQWIVFLATRTDGVAPKKGFGFVFRDLDDISEPGKFKLFLQLLSRSSLLSGNFRLPFLKAEERLTVPNPKTSQRLVNKLRGSDARKQPSATAQALHPVLNELFLGHSPEKEKEIVRHCFVPTKESVEADSRLERLISEVTNALKPLDTRDPASNKLTTVIQASVRESASHTVLIVGQMSAGKSTYLERFFESVLPNVLKRNVLVVKLDLDKADPSSTTFANYLRRETLRKIKDAVLGTEKPSFDKLRGSFNSLYEKLKKGELSYFKDDEFKKEFGKKLLEMETEDQDEYLRCLLSDCNSSQNKLLCLIYDNVDHHSDEIQTQAFLAAKWISGLGRVLSILPIRDTTYWRASVTGPFHSQNHIHLYLPRPPVSEVLTNRFQYAQSQLEESARNGPLNLTSLSGIRVHIPKAKELFEVLNEMFAREHRANIILRGLARGAIRDALRILVDCVTSAHFSIDKLLSAYLSQGSFRLTTKDVRNFEKAAILGPWQYFKFERSKDIINIFCFPRSTHESPLLGMRLLERLYDLRAEENPQAQKGFESREGLVEYFRVMGVNPSTMERVILDLVNARLLEPYNLSCLTSEFSIKADQVDFVALNDAGRLHRLMARRSWDYWRSMILDMEVYDDDTFRHMLDAFMKRGDALGRNNLNSAKEAENVFFSTARNYILDRDTETLTIPDDSLYESQNLLKDKILCFSRASFDLETDETDPSKTK